MRQFENNRRAAMTAKRNVDFCTKCRKNTEYIMKKEDIIRVIKEKKYIFSITSAICAECGSEMSLPGLIDKNIREVDEQYRMAENIVSVRDIEKLMTLYKIGKAPLSLALGFGEITVTRYLSGQIPSKEYSDIIHSALVSPEYMKKCLIRNRDKIADSAYNRSVSAADELEQLFSVSVNMLGVISCIFEQLKEVTPLMLQKLLYFIQGVYYALYKKPVFAEDCEAWVHGPVFPEVYRIFKSFRYDPIDDDRFAIINGANDDITDDKKNVVKLVTDTFGSYSGKMLEKITHNEAPWKEARVGYDDDIPSNEMIPKERIRMYYEKINERYGIDTKDGINMYINDVLRD